MRKRRNYFFMLFLCLLISLACTPAVRTSAAEDNGFTEDEKIIEKAKEYKDKELKIDPISALIIWVMFAVAYLKIAQQFDSILRSLGIGTPVGNGRGNALNTAMQAVRTVESVSKMYVGNAKSMAAAMKQGKANHMSAESVSNSESIKSPIGGLGQTTGGSFNNQSSFEQDTQMGPSDFATEIASELFNSGSEIGATTGKAAQLFMGQMMGENFSNRIVTDPETIQELESQNGMQGEEPGMWINTGMNEEGEQEYANISNLSWGNGVTGEYNGQPFEILNSMQFGSLSPDEQEQYTRYTLADGSDAYMMWDSEQNTGGFQQENGQNLGKEEGQSLAEPERLSFTEQGGESDTEQTISNQEIPTFISDTNTLGDDFVNEASSFGPYHGQGTEEGDIVGQAEESQMTDMEGTSVNSLENRSENGDLFVFPSYQETTSAENNAGIMPDGSENRIGNGANSFESNLDTIPNVTVEMESGAQFSQKSENNLTGQPPLSDPAQIQFSNLEIGNPIEKNGDETHLDFEFQPDFESNGFAQDFGDKEV